MLRTHLIQALIVFASLMAVTGTASADPSPAPSLGQPVAAQPSPAFLVPSVRQMHAVSQWVAGQVDAPAPESALSVSELRVTGDSGVLRVEDAAGNKGTGEYLVRRGTASEVIVEVPHAFFDKDTLPIGASLFKNLSARALLYNTAHRYAAPKGRGHHAHSPTDVAHTTKSFFFAMHQGLVAARPDALVVAIHGFERQAHDADIIVSDVGSASPSACVAQELQKTFKNRKVSVFGEDASRLGGLRGVQAHHVRTVGGRMIHLEMSRRVRRELARDTQKAASFSTAIASCL